MDNIMVTGSNIHLPKILTGTDDFKKLLLNSDIFVDKSLLIKEVIQDSGDVLLITRPRRWGKSLNMDMLRKFLEIEIDSQGNVLALEQRINNKLFLGGEVDLGLSSGRKKLLTKLKIAEDLSIIAEYQGQFPVITINFKQVKGNSYQEIEEEIRNQITKLYAQHKYLEKYLAVDNKLLTNDQKEQLSKYFNGNLNRVELKASLGFLSELLFKHFNRKTYILIDEYDTPINSSYLKFSTEPEEFEQVLELFRGMFGASLKSNPYLEKGILTGILRIAKANLFSDLNNVREYSLLDKRFNNSYGFTQEEVDKLLLKIPTTTTSEKIKDWYNGYTFGGEIIYNPWSIMLCLSNGGVLDHYWLDSGGTGLIDKVLLSDELQQDIQVLASGKSITSPITKQINFSDIDKPIGLFSLLLFSGYLNPIEIEPEENIYELSVPNKEVSYIYQTRMLQWVTDKLKIDSSRYYSFITLLPVGKIKEFKVRLQELLHNSTSFFQTGEKSAELFYSGFMLGLVNTLAPSYIIESEREAGNGRPDIILIPKSGKNDQAIIIEYKIAKTPNDLASMARIGLNQIINKQYDTKIREHLHVKKIVKIAIAFCQKEVDLQYQIDET